MDGFHVASGGAFPHPRNPAGGFPIADMIRAYDTMLSSGKNTFRNYSALPHAASRTGCSSGRGSARAQAGGIEGINLDERARVKEAVTVPVLCTGGFQTRRGSPPRSTAASSTESRWPGR